LIVATNATGIGLGLQDRGIRDNMILSQMVLEDLSVVTQLGTAAFYFLSVAAPSLELEMLRGAFVFFPIILAAKSFVAV